VSERIETNRLILHRLSGEDIDLWLAGDRRSLESRTGARFPGKLEAPPLRMGDMEALRALLHEHGEDPVWSTWLMLARNNGAAVGIAGFSRIEETVEADYSVYPALQHIGLATESLRALINWLFESAAVTRLRVTIAPDNTASIRVAEKLGMELVSTGEDPDAGLVLVFELVRSDSIER
jgi:RimJ/RimL family protein N-acetyltransferase